MSGGGAHFTAALGWARCGGQAHGNGPGGAELGCGDGGGVGGGGGGGVGDGGGGRGIVGGRSHA